MAPQCFNRLTTVSLKWGIRGVRGLFNTFSIVILLKIFGTLAGTTILQDPSFTYKLYLLLDQDSIILYLVAAFFNSI